MAHYTPNASAPVRPTLPPLHTLDLPRGNIQLPHIHELYDLNELRRQTAQLHIPSSAPSSRERHQISTSTSTSSPTPSRTPCLPPRTDIPTPVPHPAQKFRLVPTTFEEADAVILVAPPTAPNMSTPQPLLLVGPALQRLRQSQRQLAKGSRIHPYRIVRGPSDRRPSAVTPPSSTKA